MKSNAGITGMIGMALGLATYFGQYLICPDATMLIRLCVGIAAFVVSYSSSVFLLDRKAFKIVHIIFFLVGLVFLAIVFFLLCKAPEPPPPSKLPIAVLVTDESGPIRDADVTLRVYLDGELKLIEQHSTDNTGITRFELAASLKGSTIMVKVEAVGYLGNTCTSTIFDSRIEVQLEKQK